MLIDHIVEITVTLTRDNTIMFTQRLRCQQSPKRSAAWVLTRRTLLSSELGKAGSVAVGQQRGAGEGAVGERSRQAVLTPS